MVATTQNPLSQFFRQPKIFIRLPSQGEFYPEGSLDASETGEYAVFAMTAKDELMFKTPDALLSGQSTVEVIKSCVPAIIDPWKMPTIDVDAVLMAIRIATYGENMEVTANCPSCNTGNDYVIKLTDFLNQVQNFQYETRIEIDPLVIHIRPYTYQEMTKTSLKTFEQQRLFAVINDESIDDAKKIDMFGKSFIKLTEMTVDIISGCIAKIESPNGEVTDANHIKEFVNNAPKDIFDRISSHVGDLKEKMDMPVQDATCNECGTEFRMPITLDAANFFAVRS